MALPRNDGAICDITTHVWQYSKVAGGDYHGTFNTTPTYLVLLDVFTELLAPWSVAASIAKKENITLDKAKASLISKREADIKRCCEHAQDIIIKDFTLWLVTSLREFASKVAVLTLSDLRDDISIEVPPPGKLLKAMLANSYDADKERMHVRKWRGGNRKTKEFFKTDNECKAFAAKIDNDRVIASWKLIRRYLRRKTYNPTAGIQEQLFFKEMNEKHHVPKDLLGKAHNREDYPPSRLALEHIYCEVHPKRCRPTPPGYSTLRTGYRRGHELNKKPRS